MCTCDRSKIEAFKVNIFMTNTEGKYFTNEAGELELYLDSKMYRKQIPGECNECYMAFQNRYQQMMEELFK